MLYDAEVQCPQNFQVSMRQTQEKCPLYCERSVSIWTCRMLPLVWGRICLLIRNDKEENYRSKNKGRESLRCLGEFQNVFLSEEELAALQGDFPSRWEEYINRLSSYMASSGRHYANHCATLRKWLDEDNRGKGVKTYTTEDYNEGDCL